MTRLYATPKNKRAALPRGTANYLYRVQEAIKIMASMYEGPKNQKEIVKYTNISGNRVKSILYQLVARGAILKQKRIQTSPIYVYDLTCDGRMWMMQHYPEMLPLSKSVGTVQA